LGGVGPEREREREPSVKIIPLIDQNHSVLSESGVSSSSDSTGSSYRE
jgi:hypothetical protein